MNNATAFNERFAAASFSDFSEINELYRSNSGTVYKAKFKYDGKTYVLKERKLSELGGSNKANRRKGMMNEVNLLQQLNHPNVIKCEGWFWDRKKENGSLYIVLGTLTF
jgi:serine/threonine protein kinase